IREEDPTRLSSINRTLRGDIETIVAKALEKDKARRYQSAEALSSDIRRYLKDEPIAARPASASYQAVKFARRNKVLVGGVAATFLVLVAGIIGVSLMLQRALEAEGGLTKQIGETTAALKKAQEAEEAERSAKVEAVQQRDTAEYESYVANLAAADAAFHSNQPSAMRTMLDACPEKLRGWEWGYLNAASDASLLVLNLPGTETAVYSPRGREIALARYFCAVNYFDAETGEAGRVLGPWTNQIRRAQLSPDGRRVLVSSVHHLLLVANAIDGRVLADMSIKDLGQMDAKFSPDASRVLAGYADGCVRVFDSSTGAEQLRLSGLSKRVPYVQMNADGTRIAAADAEGGFMLWDGGDGSLVKDWRAEKNEILTISFSPDGTLLLAGGRDRVARLYDSATGELRYALPPTRGDVSASAFSRDGTMFAVSDWQGSSAVHDTATGAQKCTLTGYNGTLQCLTFNPEGTALLTGGSDKTARVWSTATGAQVAALRGHLDAVRSAQYSPDGTRILTLSSDGVVRTWDRFAPMGTVELRGHQHLVRDVAFHPDGILVATASRDGTIRVWDSASGQCPRTFSLGRWMVAVSWSADGKTLLAGELYGRIDLVDAETGEVRRSLRIEAGEVAQAKFSPSGGFLFAVCRGEKFAVWNAATGDRVLEFDTRGMSAQGAAMTADDRRAAVVYTNGVVQVLEVETGRIVATVPTRGSSQAVRFSPDGTVAAVGRFSGRVDLFDPADGSIIASWQAHDDRVNTLDFSPDGKRLVTASYDHTVRVWDARTFRLMVTLRGHSAWINRARFSPSGDRIITAANDATARVWDSIPLRQRRGKAQPAP
ncbi:MAG: hypothetical protein KF699_16295, partial [Phycisphaeraceae bacterium]|nr:hypothetical protein [Phycisphaeraceae bacterium]